MRGANEAYNEAIAYSLRGPLDRAALARALDSLVARHEVLRTRLVPHGGAVHQRIDPPDTGYALAADDLTGCPDAEDRLAALRREEAEAPFDLSRGPLGRGRLITLAADRHVLLLTLHHTVFDGWSMNVMMRELGLLYTALLRGESDPLPPLPLQYADYARRQDLRASGAEHAAQSAYWQERLTGVPPLLELPTDRPRPPEQDYSGGRVRITLDGELTSALRSLARRHGGTLFVAVLTGWSIVLSRLTDRRDIVVGTPTANRRGGDLSGLIGFFVNSLALRTDLSGSPTGSELLKRVRGVVREALDHQDLPFERVVELVNPARSVAHNPLFQTMLAWVPSRKDMLDLPGIEAAPLDIPFAPARFDLALSMAEEDGRVVGHLDYATALFDRETVERYAAYLRHVLAQLAEHPDREVADLALMDARERAELLADWDATDGTRALAPSGSGGLVERFEAWVRARPDGTALVLAGERLDYATLERRANRLAHALIARGVGPEVVVGLHTGRTAELVVGVLGILKAGGAYLPLDPAQPVARLAAMVEDAAPALVLSAVSARGLVRTDTDTGTGTGTHTGIDVGTGVSADARVSAEAAANANADADAAASAEAGVAEPPGDWLSFAAVESEGTREDAPGVAVRPAHPAYVIHTSGSTGRPKGVVVTHGNVLNLFDTWLARFGGTPGEATSAWSGIGFDASVHEILLPLTTGAVLHPVPDELRGDPRALLEWMREHRVVQAFLPPSYVKWIDEEPEIRLKGLALRQLLTGVEPLPEKALYRMRQILPDLRVCYGYGPTETTLYSTAYTDPGPVERQCPIGRPLDNTRLYLLDERLAPVPPGVTGEVYIGGASLARGYLNRPDLTAERFVPDPFVPGARMYRTGDLARRLPDGQAEFAGRRDDQVKLRGFRIEFGEVEAALLALPGVREAAVLTDRDAAGEPRLIAAVGGEGLAPRPPGEWRAALSRRLPDYMLPALFVELERLPQTPNGKLDRAAVLERARAGGPAQVNQASPRDHIELTLYHLWQRLLVHTDIGIRDSFFDIGGTSISAIKLTHSIHEEFGETLSIRELMLHPTIEALGGRLREGAPDRPPSNLVEFRAGDGRGRVVCVHPAGGTAFCYLSLAKALPEHYGVYGVQSPGINPGEALLPTVEAMAESYLRLIEPLSEGPLVITGLSYGGLVAHEMGRRLALAGHTGVSVVLLDTRATDDTAAALAHTAPVEMAEFRDKLVKFNGMYPGIEDRQVEQYFRVYNHNRMTVRGYAVPSTPARLVLVRAEAGGADDDAFPDDVEEFWRGRAEGGFLVEHARCDHWEMLESAEVLRVAALIGTELSGVPTAGPPAPVRAPDERRSESAAAREAR
ncbi:non-ribosomal peptide synthetase [Streptomyces corynorhini]|uniref:Amino acid adenylation domain-containing protein n=1 Tax=Streptomyces corynorhini TaxID=2282652 RepID=A0A370AZ76_9ACTN|nr:amino acid adenylation domain-containing protein [Streptomyces corynorhini]